LKGQNYLPTFACTTYATVAPHFYLLQNENPKVVSERLGHASITLTMDTYSHVMPDMQQGASDKLEQMLFAKTGTQ
jgi:integrase